MIYKIGSIIILRLVLAVAAGESLHDKDHGATRLHLRLLRRLYGQEYQNKNAVLPL